MSEWLKERDWKSRGRVTLPRGFESHPLRCRNRTAREPLTGPHRISRLGFVNCYLVSEDDGLTLVDTMLPGSSKRILAVAEGLGRPIVRVVLTHAHGDHVGSVDALAAKLPDAEVSISARDARLLEPDKSLDPGEPKDKLRGSYPGTKTRPHRTF